MSTKSKLVERDGPGTVHQLANGHFTAQCYARALGKSKHVGTFDTLEEAEAAIIEAQAGTPTRTYKARDASAGAVSRAVSTYLRELRDLSLDEVPGAVHLGQLAGFPNATRDAEEVERAAKVMEEKANTTSSVLMQLKLRARVIELRTKAEALRRREDSTTEEDFIEHARTYAEAKGIPYGAWRDMGVPAAVLTRAGIKP